MAVDYVNAKGECIDPFKTASALAPKRPKVSTATVNAQLAEHDRVASLGWVAEGFSPQSIDLARKQRERDIEYHPQVVEAARKEGKPPPKAPEPFDADQHMATHKPTRVEKVYQLESSAQLALAMAQRAGWIGLTVRELRRERKK